MGTRDTASGTARREARWGHAARIALGGLMVSAGAFTGAFGTIAWLAVLGIHSVTAVVVGLFFLSFVPLGVGLTLVWTGLGLIESELLRNFVRRLSDGDLVDAAAEGATARDIAERLGASDARETERRLDGLVARELLALDVTDEGEIMYRRERGASN